MSMRTSASNDGTNWLDVSCFFASGNSIIQAAAAINTASTFYSIPTNGAKFIRIYNSGAQTSGTTTLVAYASQQATAKLYQSVTGSVSISSGTTSINTSSALGFSTYHTLISAASTNATSVKTSNGTIGTLILTNSSATWAYFKLINKASAPTVGTDTAVINIGVAPNTTLDCSSSFAGLRMSTGIAYYVSGGSSLTDNTALGAAGTFLVNMTYV
jgi:hypothetical protein